MENKKITIGFAGLIDFKSIIAQNIFSGINKAAKDFNVNLINFTGIIRYSLAEDIENYAFYKNTLKYLNQYNIDGLVSRASSLQYFMTKKEIEDFHANLSPLPVVSIGLSIKGVTSVIHDTFSNIKELMSHLIDVHGCKKLAFIGGTGHSAYQERLEAYKEILKLYNIPYNPELVQIINNVDSRQQIKALPGCFI